ncbi:MAG: tetratricopeptide repeat protein [Gaiellales bacterium]
MLIDRQGVEMTAAGQAVVDRYDRAVQELVHYGPAMLRLPEEAYVEDPSCPMVNALRAYFCLLTTEPCDVADGRKLVEDFRRRVPDESLTGRERAHFRAVDALLAGDFLGAATVLRGLTRECPRDALALYVGHNLDYFMGDALALRDRVAEALPAWSGADALYGPMLGMHAFGLEECGDYECSEEVGLRALELGSKDVWAIHAVVHTYEMQARFGDGVRFFEQRMGDWSDNNYFKVHNWWHYGLYNLEVGNLDTVLRVYDERIFVEPALNVAVKMCDASAMLWRLLLDGIDQAERWKPLAAVWEELIDEPCYAFNDMHAVMAFVGAGDVARAEQLVADRERWLAQPHPGVTNFAMTARIGLPVCRAIVAFGRERYRDAVAQLMPIRYNLNEFGGSHAQRDAVLRTLLEAALRGGQLDLAERLVAERITVKPGSPYNWLKRSQVVRAEGDEVAAGEAEGHAIGLVRASGLDPVSAAA